MEDRQYRQHFPNNDSVFDDVKKLSRFSHCSFLGAQHASFSFIASKNVQPVVVAIGKIVFCRWNLALSMMLL